MKDMYSNSSPNKLSALQALVDNCIWSEVGNVVKIVVSREDLDALLALEESIAKRYYVKGWMAGHKGDNLAQDAISEFSGDDNEQYGDKI